MEANNHFNFTGLPSSPAASGLKPAPSSGDVYTNGSSVNFPQQGKSLNGDVNVNGLTTVSHAGTSGTRSSTNSHLHHSYDYLWNYSQYPSGNGNNLKDSPLFSQYPLNGTVVGNRQGSPGHSTTLRGGSGQEFWANGNPGAMGLNFDSTELYDSFPDDQNFELLQNGPSSFYTSSQPSPMLGSGSQDFSAQQDGPGNEESVKETSSTVSENGTRLLGSMELENTQPVGELLSQEASVLEPDAGSGCRLEDASRIPPPLEDSLEPFESLDRDPGTGDLYEMDTSELVSGKSPLEDAPDISALDCPGSPSLNHSGSFSLLTDDTQPDTSLFGSANLPPVLGESVLQDSSLELASVSEVGREGAEFLDSQVSVEPEAVDASLEEIAKSSCREDPTSMTDKNNKETSAKSDVPRRRIATVEEVFYPLKHGWRREVRIKKGSSRWQGETWYYAPCGKRMKQFPEVIKYLTRNVVQNVRREHFSFSPRMPVGDFFEEQDTPEGLQWVKLVSEEIPSRIQAITGKRGRPRNIEKAKAKEMPKVKRGRGRPPKVKVSDLLSKTDARILKKLEAQEVLSDEDKLKMSKIKKKMRQKVQNKQKQEAKAPKPKEVKSKEVKTKEVKKKPKLQIKKEKSKPEKNKPEKMKEKVKPKEKMKPKEKKMVTPAKVLRKADKNLVTQRQQEERQRQQMILEEMKKPTEDMCLGDHQPLPEFSRIPGLILPSHAFSDCLAIVEFLHNYGKVLGFDVAKEIPSLSTLQEGLFNVGDSLGEVLDLLVKLVKAVLYDPGLPPYCQSLKILGEKLSEISLNRDTVSEILRCFLIAYGADDNLCDSLRTKPFQALPPDRKAAVLAFLVNELNSSALIINEIDKTLENMSNHRRNKWIIEGKLRRLKIALAKKTGRPESEISGLEERQWRRSSRITEDHEDMNLDEEERRRACKARKDYENEIPVSSVPELERQIEKISKRQMFFRKKLLHASQLLRASSLGQDRYRRRYWILPHLGGIFVEGCEASTAPPEMSKNTLEKEVVLKEEECERSPVKKETTDTPPITDYMNCTTSHSWSRPWRDDVGLLPSEPLDPKLPEPVNGFLEDSMSLGQSQHDLTQSAFLSWLSQTQQASSLLDSSVLTPDSSPGKADSVPPDEPDSAAEDESATETQVIWFNLLPRAPCNDSPHTTSIDQPPLKASPQLCKPSTRDQSKASARQLNGLSTASPALPSLASTPLHFSSRVPNKAQETLGQPRRRGRPPTKLFKQIEQKYLTQMTAQPIPPEMQNGWWWLQDPEELEALVQVLHPRGIREKALHKHLIKHKDYLREVCARAANDPIFQTHPEGTNHPVSQEALARWSMTERAFEIDLSVLRWVEELEQRVLMADLQIRGWTSPDPDSVRNDLQYCEHELKLLEDITMKNRREGPALQREATHPLDLAVLRLADLEQNLERRYLREPLWPPHEVVVEKALLSSSSTLELGTPEIAYEITPRMRIWRQTLERCHSAAQVALCIYQLERSIAWEKSVVRATCLVCRKGDDDENLLLCDSCDRGCHLYCHRPKMTEVPVGDWFCSLCITQMQGEYQDDYGSPRRGKKRKAGGSGAFLGQDESSPRSRTAGSQQRSNLANIPPRYSGEGLSPSKRRRVSARGQSADLTFCEIILMEMESHEAAWPFLEPVNPRLVPGYRKIIKNPMDFATMRARLLRGGYTSCEEFAADAALVFDNCRTFNEDESEVGQAGLTMRQFFESRWEEFYQGKQETDP
ncbi:bromodomain adjacent to zinc finger domain protein 2A isoform X2 [Sceloporus undulatus]|nr:bromodomain adjacent to zinc finger domain protein 2A isoform X2 [Sceloporus undulatus]XP_042308194.1 bromodomain adjacent to zinc finger domain protein 2A isoform X2 [Sceloporus undulatus]XP_042308195.1 bromodomain adjacent to zinc finger domain protein 2A isoform X2 [Sceloporus undulatus]XP_042308196.1 bromodomain adjacent to zinc finger domain protein 2A isoform X2 [Sceloporus undulatus]